MNPISQFKFWLFLCWSSMIRATCFNPDGSQISDSDAAQAFQPCNQIAGVVSQCCGTNWSAVAPGKVANDVCQPNGLCLNNLNGVPLYWRSSCTDKTWQSPLCLKNLCTNHDEGGDPSGNVAVTDCGDGSWCCGGSNTTCCTRHQGTRIAATIGLELSSTSQISSSPTSTSTPQTPTYTPTANPSPQASSQGLATGAKIGIGVGVACVVLLLAFATYMLYRRRLVKKSAREDEKGVAVLPTQQHLQELQGNPLAVQTELPVETGSHPVQFPTELSAHEFDRRK